MITCNRCGNVAPAGAVHCQRCGAPLSNKVENNYGPRVGSQQGQGGQAELPAWLESLRVGERPAAPANTNTKSQSNFSARDLIEEGSLPNWMRPEQGGAQPKTPTSSPSALNASSLSEPNTDEGLAGAKGFNARSLIDEQALPSWMKEGSDTGAAAPDMSASGPGGFAASSLVQPDALPDWMKNLQQPSGPRARPSQPPTSGPLASGYGSANNAFASSGAFPAQQEPLQRPMPSAQPVPPTASPLPPVPPTPPFRPEPLSAPQSFSARDLIDQNALPSWMTPQGGAETGPANPMSASAQNVSQSIQGGPPAGQNGFSASSLLDMDALPPWLRESDQQKNMGAAAREPQSGSLAMPPMQSAPMNNPQGLPAGSGIAASSFIDMNALPDWLRSGIESQQGRPQQTQMAQQPQQGSASSMRPGAYPGPQRVDNVRVPSRPRGEINQAEGNEVAANVFASMLGVASAAPNFPASSPMPSGPQMPATPQAVPASPLLPSQPLSSPLPPAQPGPAPMNSGPLGGPMPQPGMLPGANNMTGMPQPGMGNPQSPQGYLGVYGGAYPGNQNNQNNYYAMGNPPMGSPQIPASGPGMPQMQGAGDPSAAKPARRGGLFNAIREWLFR